MYTSTNVYCLLRLDGSLLHPFGGPKILAILVKPKLKGVTKHGALNLKFASGSDTIPIDLTIIQ